MEKVDRPIFAMPEGLNFDTARIPGMLALARWPNDDRCEEVKIEYQKAIPAAIANGTLEVRSRKTGLPVDRKPLTAIFTNWRGTVVTREALKAFAERAGFKVLDKPGRKAGESKGLRDDAKQNYLRIIRALAAMAPIALDDNATQRVQFELIKQGFRTASEESDPGDETIRKALSAALRLDPDYPPDP